MKKKKNYLLEKVIEILSKEKGKILDLGCGGGIYSKRLKELGFEVLAADLDEGRFGYKKDVKFEKCDATKKLPFPDSCFDYVLFLEVLEHLRNPYSVIKEIHRVLKPQGKLIFSMPNILNLKSRFRFLFEGSYEFFRDPPLDRVNNPKGNMYNLHISPHRFHELEYMLGVNGFVIDRIFTSVCQNRGYFFIWPFMKLQLFLKRWRCLRKNGIDHARINKILLSKELLYGKHLIVRGIKT